MQHPIDIPQVPFAVLGHRRVGVDRLTLLGALNDRTVSLLESVLDEIAHAGGATVLDLHHLESVDMDAVQALEEIGRRAGEEGRMFFILNVRDPVREAFERDGAGDLLSEDLVDLLSSGDGDWTPISLPPLPGERTRMTRLRIVENVP